MLLAVEGGGFFSASASGYSKGLTLLLLGQKNNEEKPMRVSPWNQYQLVDQATDPDLQLASGKDRIVRGCASFACFGRAAAGLESPSPLKVGPTQQQDVLTGPTVADKDKDHNRTADVLEDDSNAIEGALKSSLKKPNEGVSLSDGFGNEGEALYEKVYDIPGHMERRKVQWTDISGGELVEIREFEPSDVGGSDDEFDNGNERTCSCKIM